MTPDQVVDVVTRNGGHLLKVRPNQSHGPATPGFSYWVTRHANAIRPSP